MDDYFNTEKSMPANRSAAEGGALMQPENRKSAFYELSAEQQEVWTMFFYNELEPCINAAIKNQNAHMLNQSRQKYRYQKKLAADTGAITSLQNGCLAFFSRKELWDVFAPVRISRIGSLPANVVIAETGEIRRNEALERMNALDIPYRAFSLLNAIVANAAGVTSDCYIRFHVRSVLNSLNVKPPRITDNEADKSTGAIYLERMLAPLLNCVGLLPDGSRFPVLVYGGYDAKADTMTISTPYLNNLWRITNDEYKSRESCRKAGQKIRPLEINYLFKKGAFKADETVLEIAVYFTNIILCCGKGKGSTRIKYTTVIERCPRLSEELDRIGCRPTKEKIFDAEGKPTGKTRNNAARYNAVLKKFEKAVNLILDPEKCDATRKYDLSFSPSKIRNGKPVFIPPTKSRINDLVIIKYTKLAL